MKRSSFASNLGFILAAAGSAIGLGNIWKFPGRVGENGGGTFIVVYIAIVIFIGVSIMLAEIAIGRHTHLNSVGAFKKINKKFTFIGIIGVLTAFIIFSYYTVVGGWVMKYILTYATGADFGGDTQAYFLGFITQGVQPIVWQLAFMALTALVIIRGVSSGIERISKVLMPLLFIILIAITVRAVTLPGADAGLEFIFSFDPEYLNFNTVIAALGQAFFSLSLGMSIMITYGSYVSKNDSLPGSVSLITLLDTFIALLAGVAIICAVYATNPDLIGAGGGGFAFISLPNIFSEMPAGEIFGLLFFVLLFFAAFTSAMSILEGVVAFVSEEMKLSRTTATLAVCGVASIVGMGYSLSQGSVPTLVLPWFDFANGLRMLPMGTVLEYLTDNLLIPLTALLACVFVGWVWKPESAVKEIRIGSRSGFKIAPLWIFLIKYICPIAVGAILVITLIFGRSVS